MGSAHSAMTRPNEKTVTFGEGKTYTLDEYGFLDPAEQWDEDFAGGMARLQGIYNGLTKEHWDFISYIREKSLKEKALPLLVVACADNHLRLDKLKSLFPTGYFRGACRIAGVSYAFLCDVNIWHTLRQPRQRRVESSRRVDAQALGSHQLLAQLLRGHEQHSTGARSLRGPRSRT